MNLLVDQSGDGPTLTLLHGWAMHSGLFGRLTGQLQDTRLQLLDLPGHGRQRDLAWPSSTEKLVDSIIDTADGGWLLGWSLGGLLAMKAALAAPDQIRGLILIAATPCFSQRPNWPHGVSEPLIRQLAHELETGPEQVLNRFLALEVHGSEHAAADLRLLRTEAFRHGLPTQPALEAGLDLLRHTDLSDRLPEIELPVVLIGGRRDRLVPFEALEETARRLPNAKLVRIPGAAHAPFLTNPGAVADAITSLIAAPPT